MFLNFFFFVSDCGFLLYGGSVVCISYGYLVEICVQEFLVVSGFYVWLFIDEVEGIEGGSLYLSLVDVIEICDWFIQFIDDILDCWICGVVMF